MNKITRQTHPWGDLFDVLHIASYLNRGYTTGTVDYCHIVALFEKRRAFRRGKGILNRGLEESMSTNSYLMNAVTGNSCRDRCRKNRNALCLTHQFVLTETDDLSGIGMDMERMIPDQQMDEGYNIYPG